MAPWLISFFRENTTEDNFILASYGGSLNGDEYPAYMASLAHTFVHYSARVCGETGTLCKAICVIRNSSVGIFVINFIL